MKLESGRAGAAGYHAGHAGAHSKYAPPNALSRMPVLVRPIKETGTLVSSRDSGQLVSGYVTLGPGNEVGEHQTGRGEELILLLDGTAEVSVDGQRQVVPSPSVVLVPAHTRHNVQNPGDIPLRYVYVYVTALGPE